LVSLDVGEKKTGHGPKEENMSDSRPSSVLYRHVLAELGEAENSEVLHGLEKNRVLFFQLIPMALHDPLLVAKLEALVRENQNDFHYREATIPSSSSRRTVLKKSKSVSVSAGDDFDIHSSEVLASSCFQASPPPATVPGKKKKKVKSWLLSQSLLPTVYDKVWEDRIRDTVSELCQTDINPPVPSRRFRSFVKKKWSLGFRPFFLPSGSMDTYPLPYDSESVSLSCVSAPERGYWFLVDTSKPTQKACQLLMSCCSSGRSVRVGHRYKTALSVVSEIARSFGTGNGRQTPILSFLRVYEWRWFVNYCSRSELDDRWGLPMMCRFRGHMEWLEEITGYHALVGKCGTGPEQKIEFLQKPQATVDSKLGFRVCYREDRTD